MTIVIDTALTARIQRVTDDVAALQHDNGGAARERAMRWVAHVLNDAASRRRWWFLERAVSTLLAQGEDVIDLVGDIGKLSAVYSGRRLAQTTLAHMTELRQRALAEGRSNAGRPARYAVERVNESTRVHVFPAPGASSSYPASAVDAGSDIFTVASNTALLTGARVRIATSGTLPAPLAVNVTYYLIRVDDTQVKLASSLANAKAGTAIDLTDVGVGTQTILAGLTPFAALYTRPMDLAIVPDVWETIVVNGVLGTFGRHFDRDQLGSDPEDFEKRYERQLLRAHSPTWDLEQATRWDDPAEAAELQTLNSEAGASVSFTVPASLTGIGYVTIETGDYPLVVG